MAKAKASTDSIFDIKPINIRESGLWLVGDTPLISNRFAQKGIDMMLAAQLHLPEAMLPRPPKDPFSDFMQSQHRLPDGSVGIPGGAFKAALVGAVRQLPSAKLTMKGIKQFFHVKPHLVRLYGDAPRMIMHVVRNQTGVADIRFRSIYMRWAVELPIRFDADLIRPEQLVILATRAGFGCGVGDWRASAPESLNGQAGSWHVAVTAGKTKDLVGADYSRWCADNPPDPAEMEAWGVVPDDKVAFFKQLHDMGPAERQRLADEAKRAEKDKARLEKLAAKQAGAIKIGRKPRSDNDASEYTLEDNGIPELDPVEQARDAASRNVR
jgi:hypothetical protein